MSLAARYRGDTDGIRGSKRFLAGLAISVGLHVVLVLAYRGLGHAPPLPESSSPPPIAVRILPPAPPPPPPPRMEAAPQPRAAPGAARSARRSAPEPRIALPASPQQEGVPDAFTVQQADEPSPDDAPHFDMNAAKQTARELAHRTRLGREGTAVAQFPDPPLETESKLAKAIGKAKRRNCKDGIPGGLLAPLFLLMDKKDHGCKW